VLPRLEPSLVLVAADIGQIVDSLGLRAGIGDIEGDHRDPLLDRLVDRSLERRRLGDRDGKTIRIAGDRLLDQLDVFLRVVLAGRQIFGVDVGELLLEGRERKLEPFELESFGPIWETITKRYFLSWASAAPIARP
jgi:hypothetical protein